MRIPRQPKSSSFNRSLLPLTVNYDVDFTADVSHGFGFSPSNLWVNGVSSTAIDGASQINAVFDLVRVVKVEAIILPGCNFLGYGSNTISTGQRNIPYIYTALDYNSGGNPALGAVLQNPTVEIDSFDHVIRRTFVPRVTTGTTGITDMSSNNQLYTAVSADTPAYGIQIYLDLFNTALTYDVARIVFKIWYDCRMGR